MDNMTLFCLVARSGQSPLVGQAEARVATAVNEDFVPAARRGAHTLQEGDRVEIVAPRQGG